MRTLVSITCVAILSAIGYFGWTEYSKAQESERLARFQQERQRCLDWYANGGGEPEKLSVSEDCVMRGLLTLDDIRRIQGRR